MPRKTETIDLREEANELDSELDDLARQIAEKNVRLERNDDDESDVDLSDSEEQEIAEDIQALLQEKDQTERHLVGVEWALKKWGADDGKCGAETQQGTPCQNDAGSCPKHDTTGGTATITIGALTTGEFSEARDRADSLRNEMQAMGDDPSVRSSGSIFQTAAGLINASFLQSNPSIERRIRLVRNSAPHFKGWLETRVSDYTQPDVEVGNFGERLREARENLNQTS